MLLERTCTYVSVFQKRYQHKFSTVVKCRTCGQFIEHCYEYFYVLYSQNVAVNGIRILKGAIRFVYLKLDEIDNIYPLNCFVAIQK